MSDDITYFFGDDDLRLLGIAAAVAAVSLARRQGSSIGAALNVMREGLAVAGAIPPDDVPMLHLGLLADPATFHRLRGIAAAIDDKEGT